jgi:hypothetical protein
VVVSAFELSVIGLILVGMVIPIWVFLYLLFTGRELAIRKQPGTRYRAYMAVLDRLVHEVNKEASNGPAVVASMRELREFPEYRDISVLLLNATNITGTTQYDRMLQVEVQQTEAFLLESASE